MLINSKLQVFCRCQEKHNALEPKVLLMFCPCNNRKRSQYDPIPLREHIDYKRCALILSLKIGSAEDHSMGCTKNIICINGTHLNKIEER